MNHLQNKFNQLKSVVDRLKLMSPSLSIANNRNTLEHLNKRLDAAFSTSIEEKDKRLLKSVEVLEALSPLKVLTRGYSITFAEDKIVTTVENVTSGMTVLTRLKDGEFRSKVV